MEHSNNIIFYVADPLTSASFYKRLLGKDPVMESPIYVQFVISPDLTLAFWQKDDVKPAARGWHLRAGLAGDARRGRCPMPGMAQGRRKDRAGAD